MLIDQCEWTQDGCVSVVSTMYYNFLGGVTAINRENFYRANGFSNVYWGWGSEDDDFSARYDVCQPRCFQYVRGFFFHINNSFSRQKQVKFEGFIWLDSESN